MVRLVLFDVDGTLIRTGGAGVKAFAEALATEFNVRDGFDKLHFPGRTDRSLLREFLGYHDIPATQENFERFCGRYVYWLDHFLRQGRPEVCAGVWDFIHGLQTLPEPPLL